MFYFGFSLPLDRIVTGTSGTINLLRWNAGRRKISAPKLQYFVSFKYIYILYYIIV